MPHCGTLAVTYESSDALSAMNEWEFVCPECGAEFSAPPGDLIFESIPREWLFSQVSSA
jgi:hypothetical protein